MGHERAYDLTKHRRDDSASVSDIVTVAGDAAIAGPIVDGRLTPLLILDTSSRPDIDELIRVHQHVSPGDVNVNWGTLDGDPDSVVLDLKFIRPMESRIIIRFSIERQAILIDNALMAGAVYLQAGTPGDRLIHDPDRPKILAELPANEFADKWDSLFLSRMTSYFSKRNKVSRKVAYPIAERMLVELREITGFRMPQ